MGVCASKSTSSANSNSISASTVPTVVKRNETKVEVQTNSANLYRETREQDEEFKLTAIHLLCTITLQCIKALTYEMERCEQIASRRSKANYIQLCGAKEIEQFLRDMLEIGIVPSSPEVSPTEPTYEAVRLSGLLNAALTCSFRDPELSRADFARQLQEICKLVQKELIASSDSTDVSELKVHFQFFAQAFNFGARGDLVNQPQTLFENVDEICK